MSMLKTQLMIIGTHRHLNVNAAIHLQTLDRCFKWHSRCYPSSDFTSMFQVTFQNGCPSFKLHRDWNRLYSITYMYGLTNIPYDHFKMLIRLLKKYIIPDIITNFYVLMHVTSTWLKYFEIYFNSYLMWCKVFIAK